MSAVVTSLPLLEQDGYGNPKDKPPVWFVVLVAVTLLIGLAAVTL